MRILQIGKYYPPFPGGMETVLRNMAEGLLGRSCEVTVLVAGDRPLDVEEEVVDPGSGRRGRLVRAAVYGHFNSQPLTLTLMNLIRREIALLNPDLVHLHLPNPLAAAAWLCLRAVQPGGLPPLAVWYHADITRQRVGRHLVQPVVDMCLREAVGISVSSRTLAAGSPVLTPRAGKVEVIPFGIHPAPWFQIAPKLDGPFLFVGRLVPYKGLDVLLDAMTHVPEADLVVVGEGPLAPWLRDQAVRLGIAERLVFAGPMDQAGVAGYLAQARGLVLPSVDASETFGLVQLEAMAAGVPVIASDLPTGVREVGLPGRTCLLVPPGDAVELAGAMRRLQQDHVLTGNMGAAGRRRFEEQFTREIMLDRLLDWYSRLLFANPGEST